MRPRSFPPDVIASSDYHNWILKSFADPNKLLLIATAADGCPVGQIRFDRQPLSIQNGSAEANVDLSIDRCANGFGLITEMVRLGLQLLEQTWGPDIDSVFQGSTINASSNACFARADFVQEPTSSVARPVSSLEPLELPPSCITVFSDRGS